MRQVQHDCWHNEGAYHFFVVFNMKAIFPNTCARIAQRITSSETHIIQKQTRLQSKQLKKRTSSKTHISQKPINAQTKQLKNSCPQKLKFLRLILQNTTYPPPILAKIQAAKQSISTFPPSRTFHFLSILKNTTYILHHIGFLVWLQAHYFLRPKTCF